MQEYSPEEIQALIPFMTPEEIAQLTDISQNTEIPIWQPLPGPQTLAYYSEADVLGFGGAAGGGKTDLAVGLALTAHKKTLIVRDESTQLMGIIDRLTELIGSRDGFNGQDKIWRLPERQIELGSMPNLGDEQKFQGRPHDLLLIDEAANVRESQARFLMGWVRTTTPGQRTRTVMMFNPPTTLEGRWLLVFFAPWLDPKHPKPAAPGELRYFATVAGKDKEVQDGRPFVLDGDAIVYDFDPRYYRPEQVITPKSRTFIPSRITDNPYLVRTGYLAQLQSMPEPLRSQLLYGDFNAGVTDDPWQVIPTAWVEAAMQRWVKPYPTPPMDSMGVDVARGGADSTILSRRHGYWFDELIALPGSESPDGPTVAGQVVANLRNNARIHIDVIGVGSSPYDFLAQANQDVIGVNVAESANATSQQGHLKFFNLRSQLWWKMREALDPANNTGIQLPPDPELKADLCAPKWAPSGIAIKVTSREDLIKLIGRSPDRGSAVVLANIDTPRTPMELLMPERYKPTAARREYDPYNSRR